MTLLTTGPWELLDAWRSQLHGDHNSPGAIPGAGRGGVEWRPLVDIREQSDCYLLRADIPGVSPDEISVSMERGVLTIDGERKPDTEGKDGRFRRRERGQGRFHRQFSLPEDADPEKITANGRNGVLEVVIPKAETQRPRRIEIKH